MRLSILFLGRNGAGPKYSFEMTRALAKAKPDLHIQVVIPKNIDNRAEWESLIRKDNIKFIFVETYNNTLEFALSFINIFKYRKIAQQIKNFNPHWIYIPMGSLLNPGIFLFLKSIKKIYTLHDPNLHSGEESVFIEKIRKFEIKNSSKIIILNNFYKDLVSHKYCFPKELIFVIPHAGFFSRSEPLYPKDMKYKILFLGRIEKYKGISLLLESFSTVLRELPALHLTVAGNGNILPYSAQISNLPSKNITIYNQWLSEEFIEKLLDGCDFVILPYTDASQSGVIPLAFGNGRTVLATDVGALSEQVPLDFGFVVKPATKALSEKIINIYKLPAQELNRKNSAARQYAISNLTWEASAHLLLAILQ